MAGSSKDGDEQKHLESILSQVHPSFYMPYKSHNVCRSVDLFESGGACSEDIVRAHLSLAQFADKQFKQVCCKNSSNIL